MAKNPTRYPELGDPQAQPRHTGIASFFRASIAKDPSEADIALIGVPFDGGVTHRSGALGR
jgi:guanidinopropionase